MVSLSVSYLLQLLQPHCKHFFSCLNQTSQPVKVNSRGVDGVAGQREGLTGLLCRVARLPELLSGKRFDRLLSLGECWQSCWVEGRLGAFLSGHRMYRITHCAVHGLVHSGMEKDRPGLDVPPLCRYLTVNFRGWNTDIPSVRNFRNVCRTQGATIHFIETPGASGWLRMSSVMFCTSILCTPLLISIS